MAAAFVVVLSCGLAWAQVAEDEFGFLERWEVLSEEVRLGQQKLTDLGLPLGYDTEVSKASEAGLFRVSVSPQKAPAPFNEIHTWLIRIETPSGAPVSGARVKFYGGMPLHNHGFPTDPRITGEVEPGTYAVEGIKFSMTGWWALAMGITAEEKTDKVSFNLLVEP
ncbi:MAG: FixH family protein [Kiloniellales bacterium]|nr:FixH family protein [Kiloniellales bacterium]